MSENRGKVHEACRCLERVSRQGPHQDLSEITRDAIMMPSRFQGVYGQVTKKSVMRSVTVTYTLLTALQHSTYYVYAILLTLYRTLLTTYYCITYTIVFVTY